MVGNFLGIDCRYVVVEKRLKKEVYLENVEYKWCVHISKYTNFFASRCI